MSHKQLTHLMLFMSTLHDCSILQKKIYVLRREGIYMMLLHKILFLKTEQHLKCIIIKISKGIECSNS